jgi:ribonuclease D
VNPRHAPRSSRADPGGVTETPAPAELAAAARESGHLAIDTEFVGEGRYRTLLCLVQVAAHDNGVPRVGVFDALDPGLDPAPLAEVLADPGVEVVLHAGRQDVALLRRTWATEVRGLFDTQVAAAFAGLRAQAGYESVLSSVLGVRLRKTASFTRWDVRPLSPEQLAYARADVADLLPLAAELQSRLQARGRLDWAREECRYLESVSDERDPEELFLRLPRIAGLDARTRAIARELVTWREATAAEADRPANSILNDAAMVEVARRRPGSRETLQEIRGIPAATLHRRAAELLEAVERGRRAPPRPAEKGRRSVPADEDAPLVALAEALVRARALEEQLAYELLATRAELQAVVAFLREGGPEPETRALTGWRRELIGRELLELLSGQRSLTVRADRTLAIGRRT